VNRFDDDTKEAFIDLYSKVDATVNYGEEAETNTDTSTDVDEITYAKETYETK
jgi:hypothetical protein